MLKAGMCRLLALCLVALLCGQVSPALARPDARLSHKAVGAADGAVTRSQGSRRELQGIETNAALTPGAAGANVTDKGLLAAIATTAAKAVISWGFGEAVKHAAEAVSSALFSGESSEAYVYSYKVKTSCNDGASTDGGLKVKITDSNGAWLKTDGLDNKGDDRERCAVDNYESDPQEFKVLLNSDTYCEVYFYPKGDNPKWEPEYVKIYRSSGSETKSATFCNNNGVLADEGWYTFDYCD